MTSSTSEATAVKDLTDPADLRAIIAYEEAQEPPARRLRRTDPGGRDRPGNRRHRLIRLGHPTVDGDGGVPIVLSKLSIVGVGSVGTTMAYACLIRGSARALSL